ncbi:BA14K family protein [Rhizobium mayense]
MAHVQWCFDHYASYRKWDDSYQPYAGPRGPCLSPYN